MLLHVSVHAETILREQMSVSSKNYRYGSTVLVHTNVSSVMAAYSGLLCVRVVYRAERDCVITQCSVPCRKGLCYNTV